MTRASVEAITRALSAAGGRYLVACGLEANVYGHLRFTKDVNIALTMDDDNVFAAFTALESRAISACT